MYGGDESGTHYANRLPKHPRLSRSYREVPQPLGTDPREDQLFSERLKMLAALSHKKMRSITEQINGESQRIGKQPRPLEDGNWICDDSSCTNVNYPRRTECNKCGKRRGPVGDQVVKAYMDSKTARGEMGSPQNQPGNSISPGSSNLVGEHEPWMGGGYEQPLPSFGSQYVPGDGGLSGRRSTLSAATEGKRLAEQLVASFAASSDPVGDAGECLASAALWLQTMKARMQAGDPGVTLPSPVPGASSSVIHGSTLMGMAGGGPMLMQPSLTGGSSMGVSSSGLGNLMINSGTVGLGGAMMGNFLPHVNASNAGVTLGSRATASRRLRFEDYKDRPSDYLREFGDPAAVSATALGVGHRPEPGVHGNWECEDCKNVNFPRRTNCFQCHKRRGQKGEEIVRKYVRSLIEDTNNF